ncbi:MAG: intermembrane transport protein PqiB [Neisseria sp.]|uniref:intermembrane transport protein PqiB n=1 Tax=Neisseria sp. TaxID=192066 RepID=UPI0026DC77D1|nr:intermembrane transport protein PqiB [Neisseria sp.]MDO4640117.1 intermembrane transport protein PqiB [Neisseria sp.]
MNEQTPKPVPARIKKNTTFSSFVWLIPLIALIAGIWLLFQNIRDTGPEITLLMDSADGIEVNTTVIKVLSVDVGRVTKIRLREDRKGVEITAQLNADTKDMMRKDTQFWVVKPRIDQSGISGLTTLVSGSYIAFTPGSSEESESVFKVSDIPPIAAIGQSGLRLHLIGDNSKLLSAGSPILYEGFNVGQIETAKFNPTTQTVDYTIFVNSPNEKLISADSQFWLESGVSVQTTGNGIKIDSAPIYTLLSGAIAFRTPKGEKKPVSNEDTFELYNDLAQIENLPDERALYYVAFFKNSVRGLSAGSPVEYKGINIGSVTDVPYFSKNDSTRLFQNGLIPVRLRIDPSRIEVNADPQNKAYWQDQLKQALEKGLNATLSNNNLILGSKMIELTDSTPDSKLRPFKEYNGNLVIATHNSGLDDLQAQLGKLLDKFNKLPLENTVGELNGSLKELKATLNSANRLISKPQTQQIPAELNQTLNELRSTLQGVSPQSPVYQDVQNTLRSLDKTMRDAQPLLNTLKEKPNSLIFNQSAKDPTPKGSR